MESGVLTEQTDVFGVWKLRAFYLENQETGERSEPFGASPRGVLIMHPGGRMATVVTPSEQTPPKTEADQAAAFQKLVAYSGQFRLEPPDRFVTTVDVAWLQPWVGTEQARTYKCDGDILDIITAPARVPHLTGDALMIGVLSWVRENHNAVQDLESTHWRINQHDQSGCCRAAMAKGQTSPIF
jgi:hypothetical protein